MTRIQAPTLQRTQEQVVGTARRALEDAHIDHELVRGSFNRQLAALSLPPRPVILYPNLLAALKRVGELVTISCAGASDGVALAALDPPKTAARVVIWDVVTDSAPDSSWLNVWLHATAAAWNAGSAAAWVTTGDSAWNSAWIASRDAARDAASDYAWERACHEALRSAPHADDSPSMIAAGSFLEILRGGAFFFWIVPDAVHVVLAQIHIQKTNRAVETPGIRETISRLHREDGPAIQYEDGSGLYFWKGIQVPEQVILRPDEMRVEDILAERNAEVRRAMMERYGQDRFVLDAGAKVLHERKGNELLSIDLPEDPDQRLVALKLRCPSTAAVYILRVPPDQTTVQGALAWSFGLDGPEQYVLQQES